MDWRNCLVGLIAGLLAIGTYEALNKIFKNR